MIYFITPTDTKGVKTVNNKYDVIYTRQSVYKDNSISQLTQREFCEEHIKKEYKEDLKLLILDGDQEKF